MISSPASELGRPHFIEPLPEAFSCHLFSPNVALDKRSKVCLQRPAQRDRHLIIPRVHKSYLQSGRRGLCAEPRRASLIPRALCERSRLASGSLDTPLGSRALAPDRAPWRDPRATSRSPTPARRSHPIPFPAQASSLPRRSGRRPPKWEGSPPPLAAPTGPAVRG